jgi:hypothetical protein
MGNSLRRTAVRLYIDTDPSCSIGIVWTKATSVRILSSRSVWQSDHLVSQSVPFRPVKKMATYTNKRLLEVKDLCDVDVPDERSVMTYVAEFFHKFSSEGMSGILSPR